jgi:hypothetical protein
MVMASTKEIEKELYKALQEIGPIDPWFDKEMGDWVFAHKLYPKFTSRFLQIIDSQQVEFFWSKIKSKSYFT